jgi:orsellinic acid C2-O-methyltransferase
MTIHESPATVATPEVDIRVQLLSLINANWTTQALSVATKLGLPELLRDGPRTLGALAQATHCDRESLLRLLRGLTSIGVFSEATDGSFGLTPLGAQLRAGVPGSLAAWAVFCGTDAWRTWGQLEDSVRSGDSTRKQASGADGFHHLENDPEGAALFNQAMVDLTRTVALAVARTVDFSGMRLIADVGGGYGELIATILAEQPFLRGILFDLAHATGAAGQRLAASGVEGRCTVVTGSFFEAIPGDADAYLLKSVLHDWNDADAVAILQTCRRAMGSHARLLVIERIAPERYSCSPRDQEIARADLNMLVATGGRERTEKQYRQLFDDADLTMTRLLPLKGPFSVLEAAPR